tara:strand:- start:328 stop:711 length:384 start_codon:yes stop_codon:yes gene_type:complete
MDHRKTVIDTNDAEICRLEAIADWLDSKFVIPGTKLRFGLDFVLGILPGVGDGVAAVPAAYLILEAQRLGAPPALLMRMGFNVLLDLAVGAIPLVGDLFDFGFKANRRNIALLKQYLGIDEIPRSRD